MGENVVKYICVTITFNHPLKASFSNKKYPITIQTRQKYISLSKNRVLTDF